MTRHDISSAPRPSALRIFLSSGAAGGFLLMAAAVAAMVTANSALAPWYETFLNSPRGPVLAERIGPMTAHLWINDGLMAVFFLLVGLEIKREFVDGELATWAQRRLPVIAAACGMAVPALVYLVVVGGDPLLQRGWAIPAATDIAFAIAVLALLGSRAPASLKLFLTTVAIVDDLGAVAIIALAYTDRIDTLALGGAAAIAFGMYFMGKNGVQRLTLFMIPALVLWYAILLSGVHATIAGVVAAATIPVVRTPGGPDAAHSPLHRLERKIAPWVAFFIVPLFGFANAGIHLEGLGLDAVLSPLPLGIAAGLFIGKQIGVFGAIWLSVRFGLAARPAGATWLQTYAIAILCGIGFTMSLFIAALAFPASPELIEEAKAGIMVGSILSAVIGYALLRAAPPLDQDRFRLNQAET